jgi:predicted negative regulator of RcsB-dependent stress response
MDIDKLTIGAIIGSVFLYDFKEYNNNQEEFNKDKQKHFSMVTKYFEGYKYGFLIKNARKFNKINPLSMQIKVL